ncbi:GntR family transcriptional regulator [Polycladidibacter stylochi]|uniref:GntR family transcriptional regulator n=1 Tax=Polycladidibacter stylochi TaxID=1807766 RepID=UPI00083283C2|nr:GntR family transcriptional regulator [Pseudovibrio stylochi]
MKQHSSNEQQGASLIDIAYSKLRTSILIAELKPGQKLRIREMCNAFDIGPTPMREALSRLVAEGLVATQSHRGFYLPELTVTDAHDILDQRCLLQAAALRLAMMQNDPEWREEVRIAYQELLKIEDLWQMSRRNFWSEWLQMNRRFHKTMISGSNSVWQKKFLGILLDQCEKYIACIEPHFFIPEVILDLNCKIMDAIMENNVNQGEEALSAYITELKDRAQEALSKHTSSIKHLD